MADGLNLLTKVYVSGRVPHVAPAYTGRERIFSNAFTPVRGRSAFGVPVNQRLELHP